MVWEGTCPDLHSLHFPDRGSELPEQPDLGIAENVERSVGESPDLIGRWIHDSLVRIRILHHVHGHLGHFMLLLFGRHTDGGDVQKGRYCLLELLIGPVKTSKWASHKMTDAANGTISGIALAGSGHTGCCYKGYIFFSDGPNASVFFPPPNMA